MVVQHHAGVGHHDFAAERRVDRRRAGDPVSCRVGSRKMRRVLLKNVLISAVRGSVLCPRQDAIQPDLCGQSRRVIFRDKATRNFGEIRVAEPIRAVGECQFHRFAHHVNKIR